MDGAPIGGEIGGVSVGVAEEQEQIVGELGRHVVHVNPDRHAQRVVRISVQEPGLGGRDQAVEVLVAGGGGVVAEGGFVGEKKAVEGGDEGGLGLQGAAQDGAIGVGVLGGIPVAEEEEKEEESEREESTQNEAVFGSRAYVFPCHFFFFFFFFFFS